MISLFVRLGILFGFAVASRSGSSQWGLVGDFLCVIVSGKRETNLVIEGLENTGIQWSLV